MQCLPTARGPPFKQDAVFGMSARWSSFGQNRPLDVVEEGQKADDQRDPQIGNGLQDSNGGSGHSQ